MTGKFFLFLNFRQAGRFGHVGWGFQLAEKDKFLFGSTDHLYRHKWWDLPSWLDYMHVPEGEHTDWWCEYGTEKDMLDIMGGTRNHIWYHTTKGVIVPEAEPEEAEKMARSQETCGWSVFDNNCVVQTFEIMKAYNAASLFPDPWEQPLCMIPRVWFANIQGEETMLRR